MTPPGTLVVYDHATYAREWDECRETWTPPILPEPIQRAVEVKASDPCVTLNARKAAGFAQAQGWPVRITHAIGWDADGDGVKMRDVMETTGAMTKDIPARDGRPARKGRPAKRKVGEEMTEPMSSIRVIIRLPGLLLVGHWFGGNWDTGQIYGDGNVRNVDWTGLWEALNAQSRQNVLWEG